MVPDQLEPRMELLQQEYVLVQAWKKTASYIRSHNWFSDTLALDCAAVNLPTFLGELRERLQSSETWDNDPLRIVLAPKSQRWTVRNGSWEPVDKKATSARLRPLAHVSLADQVVATALMLCLADRVETQQGDPRRPIRDLESLRTVVSYGNRLVCDAMPGELRHRWGSVKLYRAYFQDYRMFLSRPKVVAELIPDAMEKHVYVIHADLRQFYDRVRPDVLSAAVREHSDEDDPAFFSLAKSVLDWGWHPDDERNVRMYSKQAEIEDFTRVALPQGLVASGFFANVVLLPFDEALLDAIGTEICCNVLLVDACRYVDDLRVLVAIDSNSDSSTNELTETVSRWLSDLLHENATGLGLSSEKTQAVALGGDERPLVGQSVRMNRIQSAVSGGFDRLGGEEILDAIQGLMRAQESLIGREDSNWPLSPIPDVRDDTVARFMAGRYRTTYRSIRPLLDDDDTSESDPGDKDATSGGRQRMRTRRELDEETRAFALGLIERWVADPSNVRLLRIGLDLWPDGKVVREVLSLLRPFTGKGGRRMAPRRVAWYCLAEILRAGAVETGLVVDAESLPSGIDFESYREQLRDEAARVVKLPGPTIPWYLRQQALLFLAAVDPAATPIVRTGTGPETRHYRKLIRFLRDDEDQMSSSDYATNAVVARRSFVDRNRAIDLTLRGGINASRLRRIAQRDPSFLLELMDTAPRFVVFEDLPARIRDDLCLASESRDGSDTTLAKAVLSAHPTGPLRNELALLHFAKAFLERWEQQDVLPEVITPSQVTLRRVGHEQVTDVGFLPSRADPSGSLFGVPTWCEPGERWRFHLGFLLRFILSGQPDFTRPVRSGSWKESESAYRASESHWVQRLYGLYSGQSAFGDDWLPITDWVEGLLLALLRWPGCRTSDDFDWIDQGGKEARRQIEARIAYLDEGRGRATGSLILPMLTKRPSAKNVKRPLRACVVQTAVPTACDLCRTDLELNDPAIRRKHRNHLSAALAAVERMLALRETHKGSEGRLDWLILPELAVHPKDIRTHLLPFARAHRAMILAGLTYQEILARQPLANSALWIIPEWSGSYGLQIKIRRQGKKHLAPNEPQLNGSGARILRGFRPCQWLIGYPWSDEAGSGPVWLTAAVCYDATDLGLAADLRDKSDVLAIPALNKDVKTFDQMALALHYHMFQLVIVANNGQYGGSNAYWPRSDRHIRKVFHTYGQPQASISFLEIDDIGAFLGRRHVSGASANDWKHPPAGLKTEAPGNWP